MGNAESYPEELVFIGFSLINERVWVAGFSGGKDSSLLVDLAVEYLVEYDADIELHVVYSDTLLEYPLVRDYAYTYLEELQRYSLEKGLRINIHIVKPLVDGDFITLQLVKGYPMPHRRFRWCTEKLKIIPARRVITDIVKKHGEENVALLNGSRLDESAHRTELMMRRVEGCRDCVDPVTGFSSKYVINKLRYKIGSDFTEALPIYVSSSRGFGTNVKVYSPLAYLKEEDVWSIIRKRVKPVFTLKPLYNTLLNLYGKDREQDIRVRFGCWLCTVATRDKSGEWLSKLDPKIGTLMWARKTLFIISHGEDGYNKNDLELLREKPRFPKQKYGALNAVSRELTRAVYYIVYHKYREAFKSYLNDPDYRKTLETNILNINWNTLHQAINYILGSPIASQTLKQAVEEIREDIKKLSTDDS